MQIPDEIIRSKRKTLSVCIDGQGRLIVRAPLRLKREQIDAFLTQKEGWILKKKAERQRAGIRLPDKTLHGYTFSLLGKDTRIFLYDGQKVGYDSEKNAVYLPEDRAEKALVEWLKGNAERIFEKITREWAVEMGVQYTSLTVGSAKTRWGSCSGENALRYTFRLLYCPREIIDYVVVHELSHVRHKNHSKAFWREVESCIPDWKNRRAYLKLHGAFMQIF